ncbi:MAG: beta-ketoacyl synthase chain length factor [Gammaproteobacteria bacterium]|nr:beta-ketoacyl synthase chain length factor [Gammaproteobacteria bacterium]
MRAAIYGVGILAEGLTDWDHARRVLTGQVAYAAQPARAAHTGNLSGNEARRCPVPARYAIDAGLQALAMSPYAPGAVASVFSSASGDLDIADRNCRGLAATPPVLSPTLFHNSVHNAVAGYWGIATGAQTGSVSLSAFDDSFGAGLLEALTRVVAGGEPTLYVAYDVRPPPAFASVRALAASFAVALVLGPAGAGPVGTIEGTWQPASGPETAMDDPALDYLRRHNPAARSLPLLAALARGTNARIGLRCGGETGLLLEVAV